MTTLLRNAQMKLVIFSHRGFPVVTIKNSLQNETKLTQSEAINKRKNMNNTGIPLTMKFSGITQLIAKTMKNNLNILFANR